MHCVCMVEMSLAFCLGCGIAQKNDCRGRDWPVIDSDGCGSNMMVHLYASFPDNATASSLNRKPKLGPITR